MAMAAHVAPGGQARRQHREVGSFEQAQPSQSWQPGPEPGGYQGDLNSCSSFSQLQLSSLLQSPDPFNHPRAAPTSPTLCGEAAV